MDTQKWAEQLTPEERAAKLAKPRPSALDRHDRRVKRESAYKANRKTALKRDSRRCRIYGLPATETHHVIARSLGGSHDASNLLSVSNKAHVEFTTHVLKVEGPTDCNGLLRILRSCDKAGGYVLFREAA